MAILVDSNTRLVVQGITGGEGTFHTKQAIDYGTNVVAGVTPGKGGMKWEDKVPVFNTVEQAVKAFEKELGTPVKIAGFVRYALGEGIEKKEDDFAAEVAAAAGGS